MDFVTRDTHPQSWDVPPRSLLDTTLNTRDLGRYRGEAGAHLVPYRVLRSDVQNFPSERDIAFLRNRNITTILDLRGSREVERKPSGFCNLEGFSYVHIPIEEGSGIPASQDLVGESYLEIAKAPNIPLVFRAIANAPAGVMFNCTAGKDRTGVVSAVLLSLCGVSDEDVVRDYMTTKICNQQRFQLIRQGHPEVDMNIVIPKERYMYDFLRKLEAHFGGVRAYLLSIGISEGELECIRNKLMK